MPEKRAAVKTQRRGAAEEQALSPPAAEVENLKDLVKTGEQRKPGSGAFSSPWIIRLFIAVNHILFVYALLYHLPQSRWLYFWAFFVGWLELLGITAGFHRLWSHRSYSAVLPLRVFLAIIGTMAFQGSIKWWVLRHRVHHRFTDTDSDPYNAKRGLWYSHVGWLMEKPKELDKMDLIDWQDLKHDPVVQWQQRWIGYIYVLFGLVFPAAVGLAYGDVVGGILWVGVAARIQSWHGIWATNSLAHWFGDRRYSDKSTARGSLICAIICNGEGNHNYHHEFPRDFRHGVRYFEWDPTKWCILVWYYLGLASNLKRSHPKNIRNAELRVQENRAQRLLERVKRERATQASWNVGELPLMTASEFEQEVANGRWLILLDGFVLDVTSFAAEHPGGAKLLFALKGKDATKAFHGGMNMHTESAQHLSGMFRVARLQQTLPPQPLPHESKQRA